MYSKKGELERPAHTVWTHWVDSRTTEEVRDEGDMFPQPRGETLEYGAMVNPATGKEERYEECWVDLEAGAVDGEQECQSWVFRAEDREGGVRGVMARVGRYVQAVVRRGEEFGVARWMWSAEMGWASTVEIGRAEVPGELLTAVEVKPGEKRVGSDGLQWSCVESFAWHEKMET